MLHAVSNFKAVLRLIQIRAVASARGKTSERHEIGNAQATRGCSIGHV